jgi:hypothetical protein
VGVPNCVPVKVNASIEILPSASCALAGAEAASDATMASPRATAALLICMPLFRMCEQPFVFWGWQEATPGFHELLSGHRAAKLDAFRLYAMEEPAGLRLRE